MYIYDMRHMHITLLRAHKCPNSMICSQCQMLREQFNQFLAAADITPRTLEEMLLLESDAAMRKFYSFLCSGTELHAPIAFTVVDPAVVEVDFDHAPPCRWHWAVDMASDLIDHFRDGMGKAGKKDGKATKDGGSRQQRRRATVTPLAYACYQQKVTKVTKATQQRNMPGICWAYACSSGIYPAYAKHMPV